MFRIVAVFALLSMLMLGCGDSEETPAEGSPSPNGASETLVTSVEKPPGVPDGAQAVLSTTRLGSIERAANATPTAEDTRTLLRASCEENAMRLETSEETIYAALPCERFWDEEAADLFVEEEMAIVLEVSEDRFRILLETVEGAQGEFTIQGIWVE